MTTTINPPSVVETQIEPPPAITTTLQTGQGPAGAPGDLLEQDLPFDPVLNFENALA